MNTQDFDALMNSTPAKTPAWLKQASKGNARCAHCKTQYLKGELNANKLCRHCADELGEAHPFNQGFAS